MLYIHSISQQEQLRCEGVREQKRREAEVAHQRVEDTLLVSKPPEEMNYSYNKEITIALRIFKT